MTRKELIIGLGGCGGRSISAFRRAVKVHCHNAELLETYGYRFEYLYIDSDVSILKSDIWNNDGERWALLPFDVINLRETWGKRTTLEIVAEQDNVKPWIGDFVDQLRELRKPWARWEDTNALLNIVGAGQIRKLGRLLFARNAGTLKYVLRRKIELLKGTDDTVNVRIFSSLGGGTGSGCLIDAITILHSLEIPGHINVFVYLFGAEKVPGNADIGFFYANEYATLRDLNTLILGKYRPHRIDLYGEEAGSRFDFADAGGNLLKSIYLSSGTATNSPSIESQIQSMAEACIASIVHSSICRHVQGGGNIVMTNPGDPADSLERAYIAHEKYMTAVNDSKDRSIVCFANLDDDDTGLDSTT